MPVFDFHCSHCGLHFSKLVRDRKTTSAPCKECSQEAAKKLSTPQAHFADSSRGNPRGETGVYGLDTSVDLNVGRDAQNRWEIVKDRESEKDKLHAEAKRITGNPDAKMAIKRDPVTLEYQPMTVAEVRQNVELQKEYKKHESAGTVKDLSGIPPST